MDDWYLLLDKTNLQENNEKFHCYANTSNFLMFLVANMPCISLPMKFYFVIISFVFHIATSFALLKKSNEFETKININETNATRHYFIVSRFVVVVVLVEIWQILSLLLSIWIICKWLRIIFNLAFNIHELNILSFHYLVFILFFLKLTENIFYY